MICAMTQPTYLPWAGYFNLIAESDVFVFLDDAQYQRNSWHNRNRILLNGAPHWITIPVLKIALGQSINETKVDDSKNWRKKHIRLLEQTYGKHPFADDILGIYPLIENESLDSLGELNVALVRWMLEKLSVTTPIQLSSCMGIDGKRTERVINILEDLGATQYLSPQGASEYLAEDGFAGQTSIDLRFQDYQPADYPQRRQESFVSHLSLVDVVANVGWHAAREYIDPDGK